MPTEHTAGHVQLAAKLREAVNESFHFCFPRNQRSEAAVSSFGHLWINTEDSKALCPRKGEAKTQKDLITEEKSCAHTTHSCLRRTM